MNQNPLAIEILDFKPTHVSVRILDNNSEVKLAKHFFNRRVKAGLYEVRNQHKIPSVI
ncbi:MAG: hypothetical protein AB8F74_02950 [Saprospiraceae bacterium]